MSSDDVRDAAANADFDEAADDLEEAEVSKAQRVTATTYLVALYLTIAVAFVAAVWFDYITLSISLTGAVSIGWVVEYLVAGLVALFLLFTVAMTLVAVPVSISAAIVRFAGGIANSGDE